MVAMPNKRFSRSVVNSHNTIDITRVHKNKLYAYNKNIGKNIRYYRKIRDASQLIISRIIGTDKSTVSLYENGKVNIPVKHLYAIAVALAIPVEKFFEPYEYKFKHITKLKVL